MKGTVVFGNVGRILLEVRISFRIETSCSKDQIVSKGCFGELRQKEESRGCKMGIKHSDNPGNILEIMEISNSFDVRKMESMFHQRNSDKNICSDLLKINGLMHCR